jgi:NADPH:quinone reductase-like Zn-dependent oxidoreductase
MLANINLDHDLKNLAVSGRVVVIGSRVRVEIDLRTALGRQVTILGMSVVQATENELASMNAAFSAAWKTILFGWW